jgi:hypothetical protein
VTHVHVSGALQAAIAAAERQASRGTRPMTGKQVVEITFSVELEQAAALLECLRSLLRADIKRALDSPAEVKAFDAASEKLRMALRTVVEPGDIGL